MKSFKFLVITLFIAGSINAQNLLDIYKTGNIKLVPDTEFGKTNDWNKVFERHKRLINSTRLNVQISLEVMPDGSFLVKDSDPSNFIKFSPQGKFVNEFSIKNNIQIMTRPHLFCVLEDEILILGAHSNNQLYCTDLEGNFIKLLNLGYNAWNVISLPDKKLAITGKAHMGREVMDFVAIKNYETAEELIIWKNISEVIESEDEIVEFPNVNGEMTAVSIMGYTQNMGLQPSPIITLTDNNEIMLCVPTTGEIIFFNLKGEKLSSLKVPWENDKITAEEKEKAFIERVNEAKNSENKESLIDRYGKEGAKILAQKVVEQLENEKEFYLKPEELPYFSNIIQDSDHNILFFEYPKEEGLNQFNVYTLDGEGKFVCKSSFICDDYNLVINSDRLVYKDGFLYGVQLLKDNSKIPLRLVKFKLEPAS